MQKAAAQVKKDVCIANMKQIALANDGEIGDGQGGMMVPVTVKD